MANSDIQGTITDSSGNPISGATVYLAAESSTDNVIATTTDSNGNYTFTEHPDGDGTAKEWHVAAYYEDGSGNLFNALSQPKVSASLAQLTTIPDSVVVDNFEEILYEDEGKTLSDYYTEVNNFNRTTNRSQEGSYSVRPTSTGNQYWIVSMDDSTENDLLPRYPQAGDTVVWYHRAETTGPWSVLNSLVVGLQSHTNGQDPRDENGYALRADYANNRHNILKDGNALAQASFGFSNFTGEWLKSEFVWGNSGSLTYTVFDSADNQISQLTASDSEYTSGGIAHLSSVDQVGEFHLDNIQII